MLLVSAWPRVRLTCPLPVSTQRVAQYPPLLLHWRLEIQSGAGLDTQGGGGAYKDISHIFYIVGGVMNIYQLLSVSKSESSHEMCLFSSPVAARRGGDQALQNMRHSLAKGARAVLINSNHHYDNKYSIQHTQHTSLPDKATLRWSLSVSRFY